MKKAKIYMAIAATIALCGCSSIGNSIDSIGKWDAGNLFQNESDEWDLLNTLTLGDPPTYNGNDNQKKREWLAREVANAIASVDATNYKTIRTSVVTDLRRKSMMMCKEYKLDLMRREARTNFTLGSTTLALSTAGAMATGVDTARSFAGGAALASGLKGEISKDFFYSQTFQLIAKAIDKQQEIKWKAIEARKSADSEEFSIKEAIAEMENFHNYCSLSGALSSIETTIQNINTQTEALKELENIKNLKTEAEKIK